MISPNYIHQLKQLHNSLGFGASGRKLCEDVQTLMGRFKTQDVLDYGCGKGTLKDALGIDIKQYDPAIDEHATKPEPANIVVCNDVLEHVEPEYIEAVLDDLKRLILKAGYFLIATRAAKKTLEDGRNAHLIIEHPTWWLKKLWARFDVVYFSCITGEEFYVIVTPKVGMI